MAKYRLSSVIEVPLTLNVATLTRGLTKYGHMRLEPGKLYELPVNDPPLENSLRKAMIKKNYTPALEEALKKAGVKYEVKMCKSCGGRVKKIEYPAIEVIE